jgi:multicomponent Na+:H+ antiporter subunit D
MPLSVVSSGASEAGGVLLVLAIVLPVAGLFLALVGGGRYARGITLVLMPAGLAVALAVVAAVWRAGRALTYLSGGWSPPLGIALRADGLSAVMMAITAIVICATGLYASAQFRVPRGLAETRTGLVFWILLLAVWAAMNAIFLGGDLFNLYVALELITFAAVPLVYLDGSASTLAAALRYLLFALLGSVLYLLGTALIYGNYGTLDILLLSEQVRAGPAIWLATALITAGLVVKTALFPLHLWLPPAHAGAPPAASALLSSLVVKGSFFLVVRLWFDVMVRLPHQAVAQILGVLGSAAILVGSVLALRQARLKLLIAYSTVAQIGYLFIMFPLAAGPGPTHPGIDVALAGGMFQAISHACAKAAMFMAAGLIAGALGHDRIAGLRGIGRALPVTVFAFGIAALSLIGVPPSGGFVTKWLLLTGAVATGQWWWALVMLAGGLLAGGYMYRIIAPALADADGPLVLRAPVSRNREMVVLGLAFCSLFLGLMPRQVVELLKIGRPYPSEIALP